MKDAGDGGGSIDAGLGDGGPSEDGGLMDSGSSGIIETEDTGRVVSFRCWGVRNIWTCSSGPIYAKTIREALHTAALAGVAKDGRTAESAVFVGTAIHRTFDGFVAHRVVVVRGFVAIVVEAVRACLVAWWPFGEITMDFGTVIVTVVAATLGGPLSVTIQVGGNTQALAALAVVLHGAGIVVVADAELLFVVVLTGARAVTEVRMSTSRVSIVTTESPGGLEATVLTVARAVAGVLLLTLLDRTTGVTFGFVVCEPQPEMRTRQRCRV